MHMATASQTGTQALRIGADDAKRRLEAGESATIVDVRNPKAWESSNSKIRGAIRVDPNQPRIDPSWPKDRLTLVY
jgi:rhodanese-related sulfurtransferase